MKKTERKIIFFMILFLVPMVLFILSIGGEALKNASDNAEGIINYSMRLWEAFSIRRIKVLGKTVFFSTMVAVIVVLLSWIMAYILKKLVGFQKSIVLMLMLWMLMPAFVHAYLAMEVMLQLFGIAGMSGFSISLIVQSIYYMPFGTMIWYLYFSGLAKEFYFIGYLDMKIDKAGFWVTKSMSLYPAGMLVGLFFVMGMMDYAIPSIFAFNTYPIEIMTVFATRFNPGLAFLVSLPMMLVTFIIFLFVLKSFKVDDFVVDVNYFEEPMENQVQLSPGYHKLIQGFIGLLLFAVPIGTMIRQAIKVDSITTLVYRFAGEMFYSSVTALLSGVIIVILSAYLYFFIHSQQRYNNIVWLILLVMFATPSTVSGLIINGFYLQLTKMIPMTDFFLRTMVPTIHVYVIRFLPIGYLLVNFGLKTLNTEMISQSRLAGSGTVKQLMEAVVKPRFTFLLNMVFVVMILAIGELGATMMVLPPGRSTITVTVYNYLHYGSTEAVGVLSLMVMVTISMIVIGSWSYVFKKEDFL